SRFNPGRDEATRLSYGAVNVLCPVGEYRQLAGAAGLSLLGTENITANTMPTYAFLRADQRLWPDRTTARMHDRATSRLEMACRERLLDYTILSFSRINANTAVSA